MQSFNSTFGFVGVRTAELTGGGVGCGGRTATGDLAYPAVPNAELRL